MEKINCRTFLLLLVIFFSITYPIYAESIIEDQYKQIIEKDLDAYIDTESQIQARFEQAVAYANLGYIEETLKELDVLKEMDGGKFTKKIIKKYSSELEEDQENIFLINCLAFAYYTDMQYSLSRTFFEKIVELDVENIWPYHYLALVLSELKEYDLALDVMEQAMEIDENKYTHFILSVIYYKNGQVFKAMWHLGKTGNLAMKFLK